VFTLVKDLRFSSHASHCRIRLHTDIAITPTMMVSAATSRYRSVGGNAPLLHPMAPLPTAPVGGQSTSSSSGDLGNLVHPSILPVAF
jgi:hypothetical protein